jgi:ATP-dependent DNA helicase Rep
MYVGITRAQRSLNISYCERRKQAREFVPCEPSRFIAEMGKEDVRFSGGKQAMWWWTRQPARQGLMR